MRALRREIFNKAVELAAAAEPVYASIADWPKEEATASSVMEDAVARVH
jgi:hypothetical protein